MYATPFVSFAVAGVPQQPSTSDKPAGGAPTPAAPGTAGTQAPGGSGGQAQPQGPCGDGMLYMLPVMLLVMWLMVIRPEQKRRKEQQALLSSIKVGDRIVTAGGMHGVVTKLTDKTVTLRVDTVQMTFDRVAVARVERDEPPAATPAKG